MIDILSETALSLSEAARSLPRGRGGRPTNPATIFRWITNGVKAPDGTRARLEATRCGGRWITSQQALVRFFDRLTPEFGDGSELIRSPAARHRESERAAAELKKLGI